MAQGFVRLDAGSRAGFISSRVPPPWTSAFQFSFFFVRCVALRTWTLVDQNWLERKICPICLLLRTLVVGKRQQTKSIEVALDMEYRGFD